MSLILSIMGKLHLTANVHAIAKRYRWYVGSHLLEEPSLVRIVLIALHLG